ncbi:uncharacterized protein B0I36DRAFT_365057 [Microdochium trichocladiopsis]|uniref:Short-chain dehydrogenase/reductase family protein n=1 Tax=Microdochium trichocladiopsis TaxID=1682393 RepID=A0A9P8Y131_9PEZI|nr:uncharacterized protein B0I36DRAFT_365057 [Microdochium trichocladiopsis]KAH7027928.1 hypothetical protein B0I36DRAFT_365057 [Microdochium trichocladiopsis]
MASTAKHTNGSLQLEKAARKEKGMLAFFKRQFVTPVPIPTSIINLSGKTAIVTGANAGLGFESSRQLLGLQLSRLVLAVRSQARGDAAAAKLREEFPEAQVEVWILDMESYTSVQGFADKCKAEVQQQKRTIDLVLLNAGIQRTQYETVPETKHERVLQVNYLSTMLLTILLLPIMKQGHRQARQSGAVAAAAPPVLSVVTSDTSYFAPVDVNAPSMLGLLDNQPTPKKAYSSFEHYSQSKLFQLSFVPKLAEHVDPEDVVLNLVNPGLCRDTAFNEGAMSGITEKLYHMFMAVVSRTIDVGASTYVDAVAVKSKESHGALVSDWTIKPFPPVLYGDSGKEIQEKLWDETMAELEFAGVREIVKTLRE